MHRHGSFGYTSGFEQTLRSKYPPAKPGALRVEPLKAAEDATCVASAGNSKCGPNGKLDVLAIL